MSLITVPVPVSGNSLEQAAFLYHVSAQLAAGNDVIFVDALDLTKDVNLFRVNVASAGVLKHRAAGQADNEAQTVYYPVGWSESPVGICKVFAADSTAGLNARIAMG